MRLPRGSGAAAVVAGGVLVFGESLQIGYFADDFALLEAVRRGVDWLGPFPAGTGGYFRPLVLASLALGDGPLFHHAVNLALHLVNGLLVLGSAHTVGCRGVPATVLALLFLVHPLNVPDVYWISGRTETLCAVLYLGGVWAFVGYLRHGARSLLVVAGGALLLAPLAKEVGLTLIGSYTILWLATRWGLFPDPAPSRARLAVAGRFLAGAAVAVAVFGTILAVRFWFGGEAHWPAGPAGALGVLLVAVNGMVLRLDEYALRRWALAFPWLKWLAATAAAALTTGILRYGDRREVERLALPVLLALPPLLPLMAIGWARERHLYLPLALAVVGVAIGLPGALRRKRLQRLVPWAALVLVPLLAWRSVAAGGIWRANDEYLGTSCASFREAVASTPGAVPIIVPTVPFGRGEVPLYSNDAARALHHCLHGTFGTLERLHVYSALSLRSSNTEPAEVIETEDDLGTRTFARRIPEGEGYFRLVSPAIRVTELDRAGDPIGLLLRLESDFDLSPRPLILGLAPGGFSRIERPGAGRLRRR